MSQRDKNRLDVSDYEWYDAESQNAEDAAISAYQRRPTSGTRREGPLRLEAERVSVQEVFGQLKVAPQVVQIVSGKSLWADWNI